MGGPLGISPYLLLDKRGERFCREDIPGQQLENQIELCADLTAYQIFDSLWKDQLKFMPGGHGVRTYYLPDDQLTLSNEKGCKNLATDAELAQSIESGVTVTADTIEDLLVQLDIDQKPQRPQ